MNPVVELEVVEMTLGEGGVVVLTSVGEELVLDSEVLVRVGATGVGSFGRVKDGSVGRMLDGELEELVLLDWEVLGGIGATGVETGEIDGELEELILDSEVLLVVLAGS